MSVVVNTELPTVITPVLFAMVAAAVPSAAFKVPVFNAVLTVNVVNVPLAAVTAPITTPSMLAAVEPSPLMLIAPPTVSPLVNVPVPVVDTLPVNVAAPALMFEYESIVMLPAVAPVSACALINAKRSSDSSQIKATLLREPRLNNKP